MFRLLFLSMLLSVFSLFAAEKAATKEAPKKKKTPEEPAPEREYKTKNFFFYIEYDVSKTPDGNKISTKTKSFSAYQTASFSGHGFTEIIHPTLALHQESCGRSQISFGVIFEIDKNHDIDSVYIPDYNNIIWKKNLNKYDRATLASLIAASTPHKVTFGEFD